MNRKRINDINTYHFFEGDITIVGSDENGEDFSLSVDAYELILLMTLHDFFQRQLKRLSF